MKVSLVLPTYNESQNLPKMVAGVLQLSIEGLEILVVDDNSPDGTGKIADRLSLEHPGKIWVLHRRQKQGLGPAYVAGFKAALERGAMRILQMDADLSHSPSDISRLLEATSRADVAVGSRYVTGGELDASWGLGRRLISKGGNSYLRLVTGLGVSDVTAGFKCFRRETLESLDLDRIRSRGYFFQVEIAYACHQKGYRVTEVPIHFQQRSMGASKLSLGIVWEALWRAWQLRWPKLGGGPC